MRFIFFIKSSIIKQYFPNRKESLLEAAKKHPDVIYGLRDDSAIVVDGDNISTIGSEPYILNKK